MKKVKKLLYCLPAMAMVTSAHAEVGGFIEMRQSEIAYRHEYCIASFTFDSRIFLDPVKNLKVRLEAIDKNGKPVEEIFLKVEELDQSDEYLSRSTEEWGSEAMCNPELHLKIVAAEGIIDGKKQDLTSNLFGRHFVPFKIVEHKRQQEDSTTSKD
ncbi:MAG: hypothetical protein GXZ10_14035 [Gammaproteobacteria bacterium]|nr:hypothetical protein [Gammaproteobacteria bacterium]